VRATKKVRASEEGARERRSCARAKKLRASEEGASECEEGAI
jgi:hypothetical protein